MREWITIKVELDRDKNEVSRFQSCQTTVDSTGNTLDETELNRDGSVSCKCIYRYFDDGSVQEYVVYDAMDELIERGSYVKDENDKIVKTILEYEDERKVIEQYSYSALGLAELVTVFDESDIVIGYETYVFNDNGDVVERIEMDEDRVETVRYLYTYDENGLVEERKVVEGNLESVTSYTYDSNGYVIRKEVNNEEEGFQTVEEYRYDERGNEVHIVGFQNGALTFENKCTYDESDNLIVEEYFEISFWEKRIVRHERLLHQLRE